MDKQILTPKIFYAAAKSAEILSYIRDKKNISVFGLPFYSRHIVLSNLDSFLLIEPDYVKANEAFLQLSSLRSDVVFLPALDDVLSLNRNISDNQLTRLDAIYKIASGKARVAVTSVLGYLQLYPAPASVLSAAVTLETNAECGLVKTAAALVTAGYTRTEHVDGAKQFALRGDIMDIFSVDGKVYRVDFFDDTVEKIRVLDLENLCPLAEIAKIDIPPATELFSFDTNAAKTISAAINKKLPPEYLERQTRAATDLISAIEQGQGGEQNGLKPLANSVHLSAYFDTVVFDEQKQCVDNANAHISEHQSRLATLLSRGEAFSFLDSQLAKSLTENLPKTATTFDSHLCQNRIFQPTAVINHTQPTLTSYAKNHQGLIDDIRMWQTRAVKVNIVADGKLGENVKELLGDNFLSKDLVLAGNLYKGGAFIDQNLVLIGSGDLTFKKAPAPTKTKKAAFFQPKVGDFVVHSVHGIGMCEGLTRMGKEGAERDFVVVSYQGGDKLYVAVESIGLLSAYAGEDEPKLNKIGGAEFARIKEKVRQAIKKMAFDLSELYAKRDMAKGHKYSAATAPLLEFEADFPYQETPDQLTAVAEGLADLTDGKIMDRLLCGDVGYGKTEVAMRLAYKVVIEGKQVAFVSPTTILARQHHRSLVKRMEKFGVIIRSLTRFDTPAAVKKTLDELAEGQVDIVCGTHRALSKDVKFKDLGLMVLDEEQRFGVADKEKIKLLKTDVNILSLSATPIPRTLHMAMSGIRDISMLTTPPPSRIPVSTYVAEYTDALVFDAVMREIGRGGQVFIVYNRVEKIDSFASNISNMFPDHKVGVAHGQMDKNRLENTVSQFMDGQTDILVTSTIIENGIDMANVNTMIIVDADRLGLSQLYQLRGRIGRGDRLAYAFFTYDGKKTLTENAYKRLDAISGYTGLGSGFKLAMRDLEIRGAGNILGREQHGHMQKVGYETYLKLIGEVMDEMKGKQAQAVTETTIVTDFPAFIPEQYVVDIEFRLKIYNRISEILSETEGRAELERLTDSYGDAPMPVRNLISVAIIKNLAQNLGATKVVLTKQKCELVFALQQPKLDFIKAAVSAGFMYSAAASKLSVIPNEKTIKNLINLLSNSQKQ